MKHGEARAVAQRLWELRAAFENPPVKIGSPLPGQLSVYGVVHDWNFSVGCSLYRRHVATCHRDLLRALRRRSPAFQRAVLEEFQRIEQRGAVLRALEESVTRLEREVTTKGDLDEVRRSALAFGESLESAGTRSGSAGGSSGGVSSRREF